MNKINLEDIAKNLSSVNLLNESELDITWNYFNNLVNSKELLLFALTKISLIPMIDYFSPISDNNSKKVYEEFNMTSEQANNIQKFNIELLNIQKIVQIYCSQMYSLSYFSSKILYDLIESIPEESNVDKFMETVNSFKEGTQKGGNININEITFLFIKLLVMLLIIIPSSQASSEIKNSLQIFNKKGEQYNPYSVAIIKDKTENEFSNTLKLIEYKKSSVDISKTLAVYDTDFKNKYDNLFGSLINIFQKTPDAKTSIINLINNINNEFINYSMNIQKNCIELMKKSYDKGVFATFKNLDDIETTKEKINAAKKLVKEQNEQAPLKIGLTTLAAAASFTSGDVFSAATYLSDAGENFWELLSPTTKLQEQQKQVVLTENSNNKLLSAEEKQNLEHNTYLYSKLYCSYGYNIRLNFDEANNNLNIYGDKLDYNWIINVIDVLEKNLNLAIETEKQDDKSSLLLKSILQRLQILKEITYEISHIINNSFESHITNVQMQPSPDSINDIQRYFNVQLNNLNKLIIQLNELFPQDIKKIEEEKLVTQAQFELNLAKQQLYNLQSNATNIIRQQTAERYSANLASSWIAVESYVKGWVNISQNSIRITGSSLGILTKELTDAVGEIPKALTDSTLQLFNSILWKLLQNPSGWIFLSIPLFIFLLYFGRMTGIIKTFTWGGYKCMSITYGGFVFVYKLIKTPFGYLFKKENVLIIQQEVIDSDKELDELTGSLSSLRIGGNKRKNKKTRKNKKRKTRKLKIKHKKYYTKHKRLRLTKRH